MARPAGSRFLVLSSILISCRPVWVLQDLMCLTELLERTSGPYGCGDKELDRESIFIGWSRYCSVRTAKWNLILPMMELREDEEAVRELYDLENDPEELNDVISDYPEMARELTELANDYIERQAPLTEGSIQEYDPSAAQQVRVTFDALPGQQ